MELHKVDMLFLYQMKFSPIVSLFIMGQGWQKENSWKFLGLSFSYCLAKHLDIPNKNSFASFLTDADEKMKNVIKEVILRCIFWTLSKIHDGVL